LLIEGFIICTDQIDDDKMGETYSTCGEVKMHKLRQKTLKEGDHLEDEG